MRSFFGGLAAWRLGGLAVAMLALAPLGALKADVVTMSNSIKTPSGQLKVSSTSLILYFTTSTPGGAFQLGTLNLFGGGNAGTDSVSYTLKNAAGSTVNSITGTGTIDNTAGLTLNSGLFGAGSYWLEVTGLLNGAYNIGNSATLTGASLGVSDVTEVSTVGGIGGSSTLKNDNIYQAELTVNVPEPATMILTGSALAAGAIGAFFIKRRRRLQTATSA
ncbi:MAG: PEP-CTERM sorting domain-containing protein [Gemmataceae bacterium]|nr:PEP-CTERM sorting domain-containing protein [Gemmataceae bacterium]